MKEFAALTPDELAVAQADARQIADKALWSNLFANYAKTYSKALVQSDLRYESYKNKASHIRMMVEPEAVSQPSWKRITIKSNLPTNLEKLETLANNLWWSWNFEARELFVEIAGKERWEEFNENPVHMLQMLPWDVLDQFSQNEQFVNKLDRVYDEFQAYMSEPMTRKDKKVAYFSMEFGISNELKIYSGGLGMLSERGQRLQCQPCGGGLALPLRLFRAADFARWRADQLLSAAEFLQTADSPRPQRGRHMENHQYRSARPYALCPHLARECGTNPSLSS